jgi:site-specific DNA-adenine methylase
MKRLMPMFTYYGGKQRAARHYPAPEHGLIVEPFAGSAGYSLNHADRGVLLIDSDPVIVSTWEFLLSASVDDVLGLPDLEPGQSVMDLDVPQGARWLIGWWLAKGTTHPQLRPSTFMRDHPRGGPYWGTRIRQRIAAQLEHVRHWQVELGSYETSPDVDATWFVDPPYYGLRRTYRHGWRGIDYQHLGAWVKGCRGQVIVCEADDADWLPFRPLVTIDGTEGRQKVNRARMEVVWP